MQALKIIASIVLAILILVGFYFLITTPAAYYVVLGILVLAIIAGLSFGVYLVLFDKEDF